LTLKNYFTTIRKNFLENLNVSPDNNFSTPDNKKTSPDNNFMTEVSVVFYNNEFNE